MSLKDAKINFLVDKATELFMSRSINDVTIKDIAIYAQVSEATIYRYFNNKQTIVAASAMRLQGIVSEQFFSLEKGRTGFDKLTIFYRSYYEIFKNHPNFYKFLNEFDSFMVGESDSLNPYETSIEKYKEAYMSAYQCGVKDGSVKPQKDIEMFYFSTTHALLELCKKLAIRGELLNQDRLIEKPTEICYLIDIFLRSLNNL